MASPSMLPIPGAGDYNKRILIRKWDDVPNIAFGLTPTFEAGWECWAAMTPVSGAMFWGTKQVGEEITHRFTVRYVLGKTDEASITGQHVVEHSNMRYRVKRVTDVNSAHICTMMEVTELGPIS